MERAPLAFEDVAQLRGRTQLTAWPSSRPAARRPPPRLARRRAWPSGTRLRHTHERDVLDV